MRKRSGDMVQKVGKEAARLPHKHKADAIRDPANRPITDARNPARHELLPVKRTEKKIKNYYDRQSCAAGRFLCGQTCESSQACPQGARSPQLSGQAYRTPICDRPSGTHGAARMPAQSDTPFRRVLPGSPHRQVAVLPPIGLSPLDSVQFFSRSRSISARYSLCLSCSISICAFSSSVRGT